jgi:hypothetical protein
LKTPGEISDGVGTPGAAAGNKGRCPQITRPSSLRKAKLRRIKMGADEEVLLSVAARKRKTHKTFGNGRVSKGGEGIIMGRWQNSTIDGAWLKSTRKLKTDNVMAWRLQQLQVRHC